jgi:hypothetical protein
MRNRCLLLFGVICALVTGWSPAHASLVGYTFTVSTGSRIAIPASYTTLWTGTTNGGTYSGVSSASLPFNFLFDGTSYSTVSISLNGVIGLGSTNVSTTGSNSLTSQSMPVLAPYWDQLRIAGNYRGSCGTAKITYFTSGTSPNRIFVVDWANVQTVQIGGSPSVSTFQVRLYEGSNKIEYYYHVLTSRDNCWNYGYLYGTSGSIGMATSSSNFISITPNGASATRSNTTVNNSVSLASTPMNNATLYTFLPCNVAIAGNTAQGGTTLMTSGDVLFSGLTTQRGNTTAYQPFTLSNATTGCASRTYTYSISGAAAADYSLSETGGTLAIGSTSTPTISFTPSALGVRNATLTVTDDNGFSRSYPLAAQGTTRIQWIGNIAQGGTSTVASGDTLMKTLVVRRGTAQNFTPLSILNFNLNAAAPTAPVTFSIIDTSGQFSMVAPATTALGANSTFTPQIRFSPIRVGFQQAVLTVTADGETRTYPLKAFGGGPGADFIVNNNPLTPSSGLFVNVFNCVGEYANTQALTIRSTGSDPFILNSINFYRIDTNYGQGVPRYPLVRDRFGNPIPMRDYFISATPGVAPTTGAQGLTLPDVIPAGTTRTYYITYVGQEPGKRFARAFIRSNGETFLGNTEDGQLQLGILNFDLFGKAIGGELSDNRTTHTLKTVVLPDTRVGDSVDVTYRFYNTGDCDLRVSLEKLSITSGDVRDFRLLSAFGQTIVEGVPLSGGVVIMPDSSQTMTVRFLPQRGGSRRATIWLQTNDSAMYEPGVAERGAYYLDVYGFGKAGIDYSALKLRPAVIGGAAADGVIHIVNSSTASVGIQSFTLVGGDAAQFSENAAGGAWPTALPYSMAPGAELALGVRLTPTGTPGVRATSMRLVTTTGETIDIAISGEAGLQTLAVSPARLFVGATVTAGEEKREVVTISNTGTLPIRLSQPVISGVGAGDYRMGTLPRLVLEPGAVEYLEITYAPVAPGVTSTATLTIASDAGTQTVSLEGASVKTRGVDPTEIVTGAGGTGQPELSENTGSTSGVREAAAAAAGVRLAVVRPNPARERAELEYALATGAEVRLGLYDGAGRLVRELAAGRQSAGEHRVSIDVTDLAAGAYHCRLSVGGVELSRTMVVVR